MKLLQRLVTARLLSQTIPQCLQQRSFHVVAARAKTDVLVQSSRTSGLRALHTYPRTRPSEPSTIIFRRLRHPWRPQHRSASSNNSPSPSSSSSSSSSRPPAPIPSTPQKVQPEALSLSARLRKLSREYGYSAFGVYLLFTALDFPFCFAAVRIIGPERVGHAEHVVVEWVKGVIPDTVKEGWRTLRGGVREAVDTVKGEGSGERDETMKGAGEAVAVVQEGEYGYHGVEEAERENAGDNASIWTQLALAYAIHKSFIFIRVPLTVAATPKVVKVLRGWGWDIGKKTAKPKPGQAATKNVNEFK